MSPFDRETSQFVGCRISQHENDIENQNSPLILQREVTLFDVKVVKIIVDAIIITIKERLWKFKTFLYVQTILKPIVFV